MAKKSQPDPMAISRMAPLGPDTLGHLVPLGVFEYDEQEYLKTADRTKHDGFPCWACVNLRNGETSRLRSDTVVQPLHATLSISRVSGW